MTTTYTAIAVARSRIRRQADQLAIEADHHAEADRLEEAIALRGVVDGLEAALAIIDEELEA